MQPIRYLNTWLEENANDKHYMFTLQDLRALYPNMSNICFKTLISRAVNAKIFERICRGLYVYKRAIPSDGLLLFHAAALLRSDEFNYISLETVLSDVGVISQVPINHITVMSSGRSNVISCGRFGRIEFIHTSQKPIEVVKQLSYDTNCRLWRASVALALRDIKITHRSSDLIDWEVANEFI